MSESTASEILIRATNFSGLKKAQNTYLEAQNLLRTEVEANVKPIFSACRSAREVEEAAKFIRQKIGCSLDGLIFVSYAVAMSRFDT